MAAYRSLTLQHFRSYREYSVELGDGVNIIVGPNGSGKTNLLEALFVLSTGHSFRGADRDLPMHGSDWFKLEGWYDGQQRALTYRQQADGPAEKQILIDEVRKARLTHSQKVPVVLFEPDHLRLLRESPSHRRDYLDGLLAKLYPDYPWLKHQFERVLLQRNNVLKRRLPPSVRDDQLFAWNISLADFASQIVARREALIRSFQARVADVYSRIAHRTHSVTIQYQNSVPGGSYTAALLALLDANVERDVERGFTGVGPHRDDFALVLDGAPAAATASRGEVRSLLLALKMIELQLLDDQQPASPLLLLDDVFSELDSSRRMALAELAKVYQTLITTTDADAIVAHFLEGYRVIPTSSGG